MDRILPLFEGIFYIGSDKKLISEKDMLIQKKNLNQYLKISITPFLVKTPKDLILLDTGIGEQSNLNNHTSIFKNLETHSIHVKDITKVIVSHLHSDHYGGILKKNNENFSLAFPQAMYYFQKEDWDINRYHLSKHFGISADNIQDLFQSKCLIEEREVIDEYIEIEKCGGHTKNHLSVKIHLQDKLIFYAGDVAPQLISMQKSQKAKYDYDTELSHIYREKWWEEGIKNSWTFLFFHDIKNPIYKP